MQITKLMLLVSLLVFSHFAYAQDESADASGAEGAEEKKMKPFTKSQAKMVKRGLKKLCKKARASEICTARDETKSTCK